MVRTLLSLCLSLFPATVVAQARYPDKAIRIINPFPPGSPVEFVGRLVAERLSTTWAAACSRRPRRRPPSWRSWCRP
jgi:tripartite-type tricarboxylate transporter receptor subunit TctC